MKPHHTGCWVDVQCAASKDCKGYSPSCTGFGVLPREHGTFTGGACVLCTHLSAGFAIEEKRKAKTVRGFLFGLFLSLAAAFV